jgi:argininosuccinate lyase
VISRFAWDVVFYASSEFVYLDNRITTGSSLMPQKRNQDLFELLRARCGVLRGIHAELLAVVGSLPSSYHRDFQLTKGPLMRGFDTVFSILGILPIAITGIQFKPDIINKFPPLFATYQGFDKVKSGMPFRYAYKEVAKELGKSRP